MLGYIDESGASGAIEKENDWLVVSLVVFETVEARDLAERRLVELKKRLELKTSYEFHRAHNSSRVRKAVEAELKKMDFVYFSLALRKTRRKEDASYKLAAKELLEMVSAYTKNISVLMDVNPTLLKFFNRNAKEKNTKIRAVEENSKKSLGLQIADYVVNICLHKVKEDKADKSAYERISDKQLDFKVIVDYKLNPLK